MKKILLVYPEFPATYWSFKYSFEFIREKSLMPPLGLITIASLLPENWDIRLIDMNIEPLALDDISVADLVFISAMLVQQDSFNTVVAMCNELKTPVAAGGPYPTSSYDKIKGVDYFILNEGEATLPLFIHDYERGRPKKYYSSKARPDLTNSPIPRFDLLKTNAYSAMAVQTSRGCPHNCEFCDIIEMFGRVPRYKEPAQLISELQALHRTGFEGPVFLVDDNFIGNRKKAKNLLLNLASWQKQAGYPFSFFTETTVNLGKEDEILNIMVEASFDMVFLGIETPDENTLKKTQKFQNVKIDVLKSINNIQSKGIQVMAGFIVGFDTDPEDIFERQIEFIGKSAIPHAMIGIMLALPNTQLWRRLQKEGRLRGDSTGNNTHELSLNFVPKMPEGKLIEGYKKVISDIYSPKKYFDRVIDLLKIMPKSESMHHARKKSVPSKRDLAALFRSLFIQTFSSYGFHYWRLLMYSIIHDPSHIHLSVNMAIKGYHFFKITKEIIKTSD